MEEIVKTFDNLNEKVQNISEALIVLPHKKKLTENLSQLSENNSDAKKLQKAIHDSINEQNNILKKEYKETTTIINRVQLKMMLLLKHHDELEKKQQNEKRILKEISIPGTPKVYERPGALQAFSETNTPRMLVSEYAKSPFAKKRTKVQLQFTDFEYEITDDDFARIPGYMKGRAVLSELQGFLDNVIIRTFNEKYQILHKQKLSLKPFEVTLQTMFKDQTKYFEGFKFITVGDIARVLGKNVDKKNDRFLQMLRHIQLIQEMSLSKLAIFGGTGMTGSCAVKAALEKGKKVKLLVRDESTVPNEFKDKVEIVKGDVLNQSDVDKTVEGTDAVIIILGTRNSLAPTTMMSEGTKNIIESMKKFGLRKFSACMSSFLFMEPDKVPKMFNDLNADHKRMLEIVTKSDLEYRAVLPPHIADEPSAEYTTLYDKSPGRSISKYDLGAFFVECLENNDHAQKVIGIATKK
ncbi:CLUMA_CG008146, isoform A [Clunio marinus]|uniref:SKA complex subunit 1 n=1 Tax=Clunio marinus TaxID=568069 RepID=A0A1J1I6S2_9DIPT|nr:CLUMA_CG008146, isoform A [Clunio marinus]